MKTYIDYPEMISIALKKAGIENEREYKFLEDRRFRFDVAIPKYKVAIEFEGGVYTRGRHVRPAGYISDVKKYNLAVRYGWKLLRYTTADTKSWGWVKNIVNDVLEIIE